MTSLTWNRARVEMPANDVSAQSDWDSLVKEVLAAERQIEHWDTEAARITKSRGEAFARRDKARAAFADKAAELGAVVKFLSDEERDG